ncbi:hypothetical protein MEX01_28880 [Methylorubrum extorquens]|uniref:hypothetical protein n=1 Tax=Methylorubrum extorquens TaxID=408 RepID=UPI0011688CD0|nr:hypothetical protein [Methylorubrum extorquens]GEL42297.1 hypothetical protein MEX01_28880 [Methylorubrum extorquens]
MIALAQDLLAAGIALAAYVAGALLILGRCQRLAPPLRALPSTSNDNRPAMSTPRPAAAPSVDVSAMSIAAGMGVIFGLCCWAAEACARAHGWL